MTQPTQMSPEDAKASLGTATFLQNQLLPTAETPNPDQGVPTNQQTPEDTTAQIQGLESRLMDELQTLKAEMKDQQDGKKEFNDLKKQIEEILNSSD